MVPKRDILTSPRVVELKRKKRKAKFRLFVLLVVLFAVVVVGLSYLSNCKKMIINTINVSGNHVIDQEDIINLVEKNISDKYLYLFNKKNIFIYPKSKLERILQKEFPRIKNLKITTNYFNSININLKERSGAFLWCGDIMPEDSYNIGENCFFVNNDGLIFDKAPYFSGNLYFKFYLPISLIGNSPLGVGMVPQKEFQSLIGFIDKIESMGLKPIYLIFNSVEETYEIYLSHSEIASSPKIIFEKSNDLKKIGDDFFLTMQKPEFANEIKNNYNKLLYIDLRFNDRILYKFQ